MNDYGDASIVKLIAASDKNTSGGDEEHKIVKQKEHIIETIEQKDKEKTSKGGQGSKCK